jgi:glycosyltransferase involved in cell wall biosynthesis
VLEALAAGVPVVATRCGGIPDQVREGVDGLLVEPDDAESFAAAMRRLLVDPASRRAMGEAARCGADAAGGHSMMVDRIQRVYSASCGPG